MNENRFYAELANVPDAPAGLYDRIRIRRARLQVRLRALWSLAATLVIAAGLWVYTAYPPAPSASVPTEIADELTEMRDYLNAETLDDELSMYVLADESR
jgi:hypothetical protein